jgi:hypothetical protein
LVLVFASGKSAEKGLPEELETVIKLLGKIKGADEKSQNCAAPADPSVKDPISTS